MKQHNECSKCGRVHAARANEARYTCSWCHHLYPAGAFERSYRGHEICMYCDDKRMEMEQDARADAWADAHQSEDESEGD
jgi:hypothetical protein